MPKKITVEVTREDIINGIPGQYDRCPIALAMARELGSRCTVGYTYAGPDGIAYTLSDDARRFIRSFDAKKQVFPTTLTLERYYE